MLPDATLLTVQFYNYFIGIINFSNHLSQHSSKLKHKCDHDHLLSSIVYLRMDFGHQGNKSVMTVQ